MKHPLLFALATVVLTPIWEFIGGVIGSALVSVLSFGQARAQDARDSDLKFPWHGFARAPDGQLVVEDNTASLFGAVFLLGVVALIVLWPRS